MADAAVRGKTASAGDRETDGRDGVLPPLRVRYYRQMKPARVYTAEVSWRKAAAPPRGEISVRLIVAGAQVLPSERTMDSARPDAKALFYVTPLAKGWLRNQKLEVLARGRKVQEIPMASKVVTQRLTWLLLLCVFLVPWLILSIKYSELAQGTRITEDRVIVMDADGNKDKSAFAKPIERLKAHNIAKEVEQKIKLNVPEAPDLIDKTPVERVLLDTPGYVAKGIEWFIGICGILPIAYYAAWVFLGLTLFSAYWHMPKRRTATGKPVPVPASVHD